MGIFKKLKKIGKKVLKGAKKVFKKATKFIGKIAGSKWGKALLIAGSVVMGGIAIYGAMQGVAAAGAGTTFMGKFAAGAKGMMGALANPVTTGKEMLGAASGAANAVGATEGIAAMGGAQGAEALAAPAGGFFDTAVAAAPQVAGGAGTGVAESSVLSSIGKGALNFAKSTGGGQMLSGMVQGYAEGKQAEEDRKWKEEQARYYDTAWADQGATDKFLESTRVPGSAGGGGGGALRSTARGANYVPASREDLMAYARPA